MKKLLSLVFILSLIQLNAQNPTYQEKLYFTCKVYGFMKYYHSEVSTCKVNWDSIVLSRLPLIKSAVTGNDFNDQLNLLIQAAGNNAKANDKNMPDTMAPELKINLNFDWMRHTTLRSDISAMLDSIRVNFRPHPSCWVLDNDYLGKYQGWLVFPNDSTMFKNKIIQVFPDEYNRLLLTFKYWNLVRYFNPNNDIMDISWDSTLTKNILYIANAKSATAFYFGIRKFSNGINDVHAEGLTAAYYISAPTYYYSPEIILRYIENNYTVVSSNIPALKKGDVINALNNLTVAMMEDSLRPYISSGNPAVFHRTMCSYILNGYSNTNLKIDYTDSSGASKSLIAKRTTYIYDNYFYSYYPNDTLAGVTYQKINCDIGYVNMGNLVSADVSNMYNTLKNTSAIVFDVRNYPNGTVFDIADLMFPKKIECAKFKIPDVTYPGTFFWDNSSFGLNNNTSAYKGKVFILVDQETQSHAEYTAMILKAMPGAFIVGSQTAGADGNISYFNISRDLTGGFTTLGVYFPDGRNTQRTGIVPDTICQPTRNGIMKNKDEVLNMALKLAGCYNSGAKKITKNNTFSLYPNPNNGKFDLETTLSGIQNIQVIDAAGKVVYNGSFENVIEIDLSWLNNGLYNLVITNSNSSEIRPFIIIR